jgi:glycosyltransferase involved in cell wall biosynthesis
MAAPDTTPGVSVIIPAYNYGRFLATAISSVLTQEYPHFELIVVDDGSTDDTAQIVQQFTDSRLRYVHKQNAGLSAARNTGIAAARFPLVAFLDADDEWLPGFLKQAVAAFARLPEEFALVACRHTYINAAGDRLHFKRLDVGLPQEITCRDIIFRTHFQPSCVVTKKSVFTTCGDFDTTLRSSEDRDMWIRIANRYRVYLLDQCQARIRRHPGSMSKHADRMKTNVRQVINQSYRRGFAPRGNALFWLRVLSFHHFQNAWMYRDEGRRGAALREMLLSIIFWPFFRRPNSLNEPVLFRLRSLIRFSRELLTGRPLD